jgi:hypothetical protein
VVGGHKARITTLDAPTSPHIFIRAIYRQQPGEQLSHRIPLFVTDLRFTNHRRDVVAESALGYFTATSRDCDSQNDTESMADIFSPTLYSQRTFVLL